MKPYTYLLINIGCIIVPLLFSFFRKHAFYKTWKSFWPANLLVALFFVIWDMKFTQMGVWGFNPDYLTGIHIGNLPLEEVLFFICIPYACTFTYFSFQYLKSIPFQIGKTIPMVWVFLILILAGVFYNRWYTGLTFLLVGLYMIFRLFRKLEWTLLLFTYFAILPFFFLSNGILTGSFLKSPIVWYNDAENLGIRIFTIPIEDSMYGFLLIAMNIDLYNSFRRKSNNE